MEKFDYVKPEIEFSELMLLSILCESPGDGGTEGGGQGQGF